MSMAAGEPKGPLPSADGPSGGVSTCCPNNAGRYRLFVAVLALLLLVGGVVAASAAAGRLSALNPLLMFREAKPRISNSMSGRPIIKAKDLLPGHVARGKARIRNKGSVEGVLYLRLRNLRNTPPDQPRLSDKLWLRIWWKKANGRTHRVWAGPLTKFHRVRACVLRPGQSRVFRFSVRFYSGWQRPARSDSSVMGHSTRFGLLWKIVPRRF
jgi:hypothetical protein